MSLVKLAKIKISYDDWSHLLSFDQTVNKYVGVLFSKVVSTASVLQCLYFCLCTDYYIAALQESELEVPANKENKWYIGNRTAGYERSFRCSSVFEAGLINSHKQLKKKKTLSKIQSYACPRRLCSFLHTLVYQL